MPSHKPLVEQAVAPRSWQVSRGSGAPLAAFRHWPGEPGRLQLRQAPVQLFSQHTPSTHWPDSHWLESGHDCPFFRLPHTPVMPPSVVCCTHWWPAWQSLSLVQFFTQELLVQRKGEQSTSWESRQVPLPSQVRGVFSNRPEQEDGPHTVFCG